jgi:hypothetical protein
MINRKVGMEEERCCGDGFGLKEEQIDGWVVVCWDLLGVIVNTAFSLVLHMICPPFIRDLYLECIPLPFLYPFEHL